MHITRRGGGRRQACGSWRDAVVFVILNYYQPSANNYLGIHGPFNVQQFNSRKEFMLTADMRDTLKNCLIRAV